MIRLYQTTYIKRIYAHAVKQITWHDEVVNDTWTCLWYVCTTIIKSTLSQSIQNHALIHITQVDELISRCVHMGVVWSSGKGLLVTVPWYIYIEREGGGGRDRDRNTERERETETHSKRERDRQRETETERETETDSCLAVCCCFQSVLPRLLNAVLACWSKHAAVKSQEMGICSHFQNT